MTIKFLATALLVATTGVLATVLVAEISARQHLFPGDLFWVAVASLGCLTLLEVGATKIGGWIAPRIGRGAVLLLGRIRMGIWFPIAVSVSLIIAIVWAVEKDWFSWFVGVMLGAAVIGSMAISSKP